MSPAARKILRCGEESMADFKQETSPDSEGWEFYMEKERVRIYKKTRPGYALCMVKGVGLIDCPPEGVLMVLLDRARKPQWDKMYKEGREVEEITPNCSVAHDSFKPVFPTSGRDFCTVSMIDRAPDGTLYVSARSVEHAQCPEVSGVVRGNVILAGFVIAPALNNQSEVTYLTFADVKGSIPAFVLNKITVEQPLCVANLRPLAEAIDKSAYINKSTPAQQQQQQRQREQQQPHQAVPLPQVQRGGQPVVSEVPRPGEFVLMCDMCVYVMYKLFT